MGWVGRETLPEGDGGGGVVIGLKKEHTNVFAGSCVYGFRMESINRQRIDRVDRIQWPSHGQSNRTNNIQRV